MVMIFILFINLTPSYTQGTQGKNLQHSQQNLVIKNERQEEPDSYPNVTTADNNEHLYRPEHEPEHITDQMWDRNSQRTRWATNVEKDHEGVTRNEQTTKPLTLGRRSFTIAQGMTTEKNQTNAAEEMRRKVCGDDCVNVAFNKYARQSSTANEQWNARRAVDGVYNASIRNNSCTHTKTEYETWWVVDLEKMFDIVSIRITNRADCCTDRLKNFTLEVFEQEPKTPQDYPETTESQICSTIIEALPVGQTEIACEKQVRGRYVRLLKYDGTSLTLCEFEVFGTLVSDDDDHYSKSDASMSKKTNALQGSNKIHYSKACEDGCVNVALHKSASQSSLSHFKWFAGVAVDGSKYDRIWEDSCTHTKTEDETWWMVDLEEIFDIVSIRITNRADCCADRLKKFVLEVSEQEPTTLQGFPGKTDAQVCLTRLKALPFRPPVELVCEKPVRGRYVRLYKNDGTALTLCEFQVFSPRKEVDIVNNPEADIFDGTPYSYYLDEEEMTDGC